MSAVFLTAEWRKLAILNYAVEPTALQAFVPSGVELDTWNNTCYVSLVGFLFLDTRLKGIPIPFHRNFEEVNLRYYVKRVMPDGSVRRGVSFIRELVPRAAISIVARTIYNEPYETVRMWHTIRQKEHELEIVYGWRKNGEQQFSVKASPQAEEMLPDSEPEFITEHYWGYTRLTDGSTSEYPVEHPRWKIYPVQDYSVSVDFEKVYGPQFAFLNQSKPVSAMLAEGSEIVVKNGGRI